MASPDTGVDMVISDLFSGIKPRQAGIKNASAPDKSGQKSGTVIKSLYGGNE